MSRRNEKDKKREWRSNNNRIIRGRNIQERIELSQRSNKLSRGTQKDKNEKFTKGGKERGGEWERICVRFIFNKGEGERYTEISRESPGHQMV